MTKFLKIAEKSHFGAIFDHFWSFLPKPNFPVKIPQTIPQGALIPFQISQKTNV